MYSPPLRNSRGFCLNVSIPSHVVASVTSYLIRYLEQSSVPRQRESRGAVRNRRDVVNPHAHLHTLRSRTLVILVM
jgi:hypothetical protein